MIGLFIKNRIDKALIKQENEIKEALLGQLDEMQRNYEHSMELFHTMLYEKMEDIDGDKVYSIDDIKLYFKNHPELYETGWLAGYGEAINYIDSIINKK